MASHYKTFFFSITLFSFLSNVYANNNNTINKWCKTTPHPRVCISFMSSIKPLPQNPPTFRTMAIQTAFQKALLAQSYTTRFGPHCKTTRQRAAWTDCLKLYNDVLFQLNRTLQCLSVLANATIHRRRCTDFDAQTWLSSALTDIDLCVSGAADLNVTDFIAPIKCRDVSKMISNCLAINGGFLEQGRGVKVIGDQNRSFPMWVSEGDRKLLQSWPGRVRANLVVAKDGSGRFRTVQAAIDAAARRQGKGRFVIYVKRGVYRENIEVGNDNGNLMLVGDGMRFTVITSGRSVAAGFTTFSSATAGEWWLSESLLTINILCLYFTVGFSLCRFKIVIYLFVSFFLLVKLVEDRK